MRVKVLKENYFPNIFHLNKYDDIYSILKIIPNQRLLISLILSLLIVTHFSVVSPLTQKAVSLLPDTVWDYYTQEKTVINNKKWR